MEQQNKQSIVSEIIDKFTEKKIQLFLDYLTHHSGKVIAIEGNIGSGKSTLLSHLEKTMGLNVIQEDVESWKNEGWLELFYSDLKRYSGTFQLRTQISHIENKRKFRKDLLNIIERSPISNKYIFGEMLKEDGFLHSKEYDIIGKVNDLAGWYPDLVIVLLCDPEVCFERIKKRGRDGENIPSLEYLKSLHQKHLELIDKIPEMSVIIIDTTNLTPEEIVFVFLEKLVQTTSKNSKS
jgi:deoxyadenosine/deoxycytidine kinase